MAALSHAQARDIVAQAWRQVHGRAPTEAELAFTQAIALLETGYGRVGQFAAMADRGQFNWGALERAMPASGVCPPGTVPGQDIGNVCFLVFSSDVDAAAQFVRTLTKRHWPVIQAMNDVGTPEAVATAMRVPPPYYTGRSGSNEDRINAYAAAIRNALGQIGAPAQFGGTSSSNWLTWALILSGAGLAGYWWWDSSGRRQYGHYVRGLF